MPPDELQPVASGSTEHARRTIASEINREPTILEELEARYDTVWSHDMLKQDFEVLGFAAPFVIVRRRADGQLGSLMFQHHPRFYFAWAADE